MMATFLLILLPVIQFKIQRKINPLLYYSNVSVAGLVILIVPLCIRFACSLHPVAATAVIFEQIRYAMKMISFIVENHTSNDSETSDDDVFVEDGVQIPTVKSCLYYLFAPTLIYQHSYPMRDHRDWKNIICWFLEIIAICWTTLTILNHGFMDAFSKVGLKEMTSEEMWSIYNQSTLLGVTAMTLGIGYGFLHCWNNMWGELLYFGDRTFYKNFMTSSNALSMFNKWNVLIHSWIVAYLFKPAIRYTGNRPAAIIFSFFVSFIVHDYAVAIPLTVYSIQFTSSILIILLGLPLILAIDDFVTKHPIPSKLNVNIFYIGCLAVPNLVMVLSTKYYWHHNCPQSEVTMSDLFSIFPLTRLCDRL